MKKVLFIAFMAIVSLHLQAAVHPDTWHSLIADMAMNYTHRTYELGKDTIINNQTYTPVIYTDVYGTDHTSTGIMYLLRYEEDYAKVYKKYVSRYFSGRINSYDSEDGLPDVCIPGLTGSRITVPQGAAYFNPKGWYLISAYDPEGKMPSVIYALSGKTGEFKGAAHGDQTQGTGDTFGIGNRRKEKGGEFYADQIQRKSGQGRQKIRRGKDFL